jgi:hypothetical protein
MLLREPLKNHFHADWVTIPGGANQKQITSFIFTKLPDLLHKAKHLTAVYTAECSLFWRF